MLKNKTKIYIIPGFAETARMKNYKEIKSIAKNFGFKTVSVKINWNKNKTVSHYIQEVKRQIPAGEHSTILGFSFGAFIAYNIAKEYKFSDFIFCTISPYFKTNLKEIPSKSKKYFGRKFINDLNKYKINSGTKNRAWFLVGDQDWNLAIKTNLKTREKWAGKSDFIIVKKAGHELSPSNYVKEVRKIFEVVWINLKSGI